MGNTLSSTKYVSVDLYKWSSSEFPQEYALIYTSLDDDSKTSTLRLRVNTDKVLCSHVDDMCEDHPARFHMKVTALRDSKGDCKFEQVIVVCNGSNKDLTVEDDYVFITYYCEDEGGDFRVKSRDQKFDRENLGKTYWEFCHSYDIGIRRKLKYFVSIQCNKRTGLCVRFSGPFMYKGVVFEDELGLQSKREVLGMPPKALNINVEREFEGEVYTLLKENDKGTVPSAQAATSVINTAGQATGLINNIGGQTQGNFNGAILKNCHFFAPP